MPVQKRVRRGQRGHLRFCIDAGCVAVTRPRQPDSGSESPLTGSYTLSCLAEASRLTGHRPCAQAQARGRVKLNLDDGHTARCMHMTIGARAAVGHLAYVLRQTEERPCQLEDDDLRAGRCLEDWRSRRTALGHNGRRAVRMHQAVRTPDRAFSGRLGKGHRSCHSETGQTHARLKR
ncbi:hypothetical protein C8Q74DRAFT_614393 [Fomes fomentarius]|nr:hypothetical protein C8Q74DRAFT_614393 [Fomes fomentarius]